MCVGESAGFGAWCSGHWGHKASSDNYHYRVHQTQDVSAENGTNVGVNFQTHMKYPDLDNGNVVLWQSVAPTHFITL